MDNYPPNQQSGSVEQHRLRKSWCLWEKYQTNYLQNANNYDENMEIIYTFESLEKFARLWKHTTYSRPGELFFDIVSKSSKTFKLNAEDPTEKTVEGLLIFKEGVLPKWEDPLNQKGCSLCIEFEGFDARKINLMWKFVLFAIVGENFPYAECINGLRVLDRLKKYNLVKLELWLSCGIKGYKQDSVENRENTAKIHAITEFLSKLLSRVQEVSPHQLIKKEHFIASRVN